MKYLAFFFLLFILFSCGTSKKEHSLKEDFDKLENIFSTANWKFIDEADTSYWYFSKLGDLNYTVYNFKMKEGDSSVSEISYINNLDNTIKWVRSGDTLGLTSIDSTTAIWNISYDENKRYTFKKISDSSIMVMSPGDKKSIMSKTLSLATFLVRSKYDYMHNTHTVDSPLVKPRGKPLNN